MCILLRRVHKHALSLLIPGANSPLSAPDASDKDLRLMTLTRVYAMGTRVVDNV